MRTTIIDELARRRVMAIVRGRTAEHFAAIADCLAECGLEVIEFALTGQGAIEALMSYARSCPAGTWLGAGTVVTRELARASVDSGARYLVTPAYIPEVIEEAARLGVPVLSGALTPSEVVRSWAAGVAAVKLFPASLGGASYLGALRAPLPDIPLVPTGGVRIEDIKAYLAAGALAVGMGGPLIGDACDTGDLQGLRQRALAVLAECGGR